MNEIQNQLSLRQKLTLLLFENKTSLAIICLILLNATMFLPNLGVLIAVLFAVLAAFIGKKEGSFKAIGFLEQSSWLRTILIGAALGIVIQLAYSIVIDPFIEKIIGTPINLENFDEIRGSLPYFLIWLVIGWVMGGFLEEFTFRGYLITRLVNLFGDNGTSKVIAVLMTSMAFGMAHAYQGASGMISTGSIAVLLGMIFINSRYNIWVPIFAHGFMNTVGLLLIYTSWDKVLNGLIK